MNKKGNKKAPLTDNTFFLLGAFIISMIILNAFEIFSQVKYEGSEEFGNGILLTSKEGEKFINYTLFERGFFGKIKEKQIIMRFDENFSGGLLELSDIKNGINKKAYASEKETSENELSNKKMPEKANDGKVLAMWTNGHPIQAITGFEAMFYSPASDYLFFSKEKKWDGELYGKFSDSKAFKEFSEILIYGDTKRLWDFAKVNNCSYLFLSENDLYEFPYLFSYVNGRYLNKKEDILLMGIKSSLLYQLLLEKELKQGCDNSEFDLIYSDSNSRIFRVC